MSILKYLILFVLTVLVISLGIYIVTNLPENQVQSSGQNTDMTSIKDRGSSSIIQNILSEMSKKSEHDSNSNEESEESIDIAVIDGGGSGSGSSTNNTIPPVYIPDYVSPCVSNYNLTMHTIIFYYANESHSNVMVPIVENLSSEYVFYKTQDIWDSSFNECFGLSGITPTFVCAGTREKTTGELSSSGLRAFISRC